MIRQGLTPEIETKERFPVSFVVGKLDAPISPQNGGKFAERYLESDPTWLMDEGKTG